MTLAGQVEENVLDENSGNGKRKAKRSSRANINPGESRLALMLIAPTILLLALIVGYPIIKAIYQSFLTDPGLDAATGLFNQGNEWAGLTNYTHWLLQPARWSAAALSRAPRAIWVRNSGARSALPSSSRSSRSRWRRPSAWASR